MQLTKMCMLQNTSKLNRCHSELSNWYWSYIPCYRDSCPCVSCFYHIFYSAEIEQKYEEIMKQTGILTLDGVVSKLFILTHTHILRNLSYTQVQRTLIISVNFLDGENVVGCNEFIVMNKLLWIFVISSLFD